MTTNLAHHADTVGIFYELNSILDRVAPARLFPKEQPLEVELGAGDGSFLVEYARRHPEHNFIGIERLLGRLRKLERKGHQAGLRNLRAIRIESSYFMRYLVPPGSVSALHIYFPDPWPKRRHWRHRLINSEFPALAHQALAPNGTVFLRTDDQVYLSQMLAAFRASALFQSIDTPAQLTALLTDFEQEFRARAIPTLLAAFQAGPEAAGTGCPA